MLTINTVMPINSIRTVMVVPLFPAHGFGSTPRPAFADVSAPSE